MCVSCATLTLSLKRDPLAEGGGVQEDRERGGGGRRVPQQGQLPGEQEQLVDQVSHQQVVLNHVLNIVTELHLHFLQQSTRKLHLWKECHRL